MSTQPCTARHQRGPCERPVGHTGSHITGGDTNLVTARGWAPYPTLRTTPRRSQPTDRRPLHERVRVRPRDPA